MAVGASNVLPSLRGRQLLAESLRSIPGIHDATVTAGLLSSDTTQQPSTNPERFSLIPDGRSICSPNVI
jgi:hypothetical protein